MPVTLTKLCLRKSCLALLGAVGIGAALAEPAGQFVDDFAQRDPGAAGWTWATGDGASAMRFTAGDGSGHIDVDARDDQRNIWWAFIRHAVTPAIDAAALARPDRELRVEARVRTDTAPRRINLHVNHTRTTDFHSHLMEFDLPSANEWFDISMTTRDFDAGADDEVFVQLALMDWGRQMYRLEIDTIKVSIVDPADAGPDTGRPLPYRPAVAPPGAYVHELPVAAAATVDRAAPDTAGTWHAPDARRAGTRVLAGPSQIVILRWDFAGIGARRVPGWGVLALATDSIVERRGDLESYTELRVAEILAGDPGWTPAAVTYDSLLASQPEAAVINEQPMIDVPAGAAGATTLVPVSPPVLERLLDGRSKGLAILSHGGVIATFSAEGDRAPTLHFDTKSGKHAEPEEGTSDHDN